MAKVPGTRYERGNDLADALLGFLAGSADAASYRGASLARRSLSPFR